MLIFPLSRIVPGCPLKWYALGNLCFHVSSNIAADEEMAEANCHQEGGRLFYAKNDQDNALIEKLIRTMEINRNLNNTKCLLLGDWNLNNTAVLPVWSDQLNVSLPSGLAFSSLNSTRACAVQASDGQWYRNRCTFKTCSPVCTAPRGKNCDGVISQNASSQSIAHNYNVRNLLR